ncbi:hypothetical protein PYCCODRAFT_1205447 [Trametes coccinea BRFM310]|uniref:Uncharacterized protein n=1 Tax=Trametes coccinea (strain BRFM310) TaxID=1353009 RepID=A0A1Y2I8Z6_TRAC3|nr:hypothetical protein PYCCODRAFT_1205447 [Trametes coccinea BRFM310]
MQERGTVLGAGPRRHSVFQRPSCAAQQRPGWYVMSFSLSPFLPLRHGERRWACVALAGQHSSDIVDHGLLARSVSVALVMTPESSSQECLRIDYLYGTAFAKIGRREPWSPMRRPLKMVRPPIATRILSLQLRVRYGGFEVPARASLLCSGMSAVHIETQTIQASVSGRKDADLTPTNICCILTRLIKADAYAATVLRTFSLEVSHDRCPFATDDAPIDRRRAEGHLSSWVATVHPGATSRVQ